MPGKTGRKMGVALSILYGDLAMGISGPIPDPRHYLGAWPCPIQGTRLIAPPRIT